MTSSTRWLSAWLCAGLVATLAACNSGGSGNGTFVPGAAPVANSPAAADDGDKLMPSLTPEQLSNDSANADPDTSKGLNAVNTYPGAVIGKADAFKPTEGDYPAGGRGQIVNHVPCKPVMYQNAYHVHMYLGIVNNGKQIALPAAIGMNKPGAAVNGFVDTASCFYYVHTHDSSGIVHIEVPRMLPYSDTVYSLHKLLDIWGLHVAKDAFGPFHGPMHVYIGQAALKQTTVSSYKLYTGNLDAIKLYSHEVIWLEMGTTYYRAKSLPPVTFYMEY